MPSESNRNAHMSTYCWMRLLVGLSAPGGQTTSSWQLYDEDDSWPDSPYWDGSWIGPPSYTRKCAVSVENTELYHSSPPESPPSAWAVTWDVSESEYLQSLQATIVHELGHAASIQHHDPPPGLSAVPGYVVTFPEGSVLDLYSPIGCVAPVEVNCRFAQTYMTGDLHCWQLYTKGQILGALNGDQDLDGNPGEPGEFVDTDWESIPDLYRFCSGDSETYCDPLFDPACQGSTATENHASVEAGHNCANQVAISATQTHDVWDK